MAEPAPSAHQAIPELIREHGPQLYAVTRQLCRTPEEAEDLFQETFLQAFRKWEQFEGRSAPTSWLYTIASRLCRRLHRKRAGEPERLESLEELLPFDEEVMPAATDAGPPPDPAVLQSYVAERLRTLPLEFRMPLLLKEIVGLPLAQIAEILEISEATAKTRVHRARLKLRKAVLESLPTVPVVESAYPAEVCLDLLEAKQEALDRGLGDEPFSDVICERCQGVFRTLDLAGEVCQRMAGDVPLDVLEALRRRIADEGAV